MVMPLSQMETVMVHSPHSTNWFEPTFLVRAILATILSYISLPAVWIVSLVVRDVARDMPLTIRYTSFWQHVFASKLPVLLLIGSCLAIAFLALIVWRQGRDVAGFPVEALKNSDA